MCSIYLIITEIQMKISFVIDQTNNIFLIRQYILLQRFQRADILNNCGGVQTADFLLERKLTVSDITTCPITSEISHCTSRNLL